MEIEFSGSVCGGRGLLLVTIITLGAEVRVECVLGAKYTTPIDLQC